jgi:hypothetical protein
VDQSLPYTNARNLLWWPMAFGPHGLWTTATNLLGGALVGLQASLGDATGGLRPAYFVRNVSEAGWPSAVLTGVFKPALKTVTGDIVPRMYQALYNLALIPVSTNQQAFSPIHLVGRTFEQLLLHDNTSSITPAIHDGPIIGTPFYFTAQLQTWFDTIRSSLPSRPTSFVAWDRFIFDFVSAWRDQDGATAAAFQFPSPTTLDALRGQPNIPRNDPKWAGAFS